MNAFKIELITLTENGVTFYAKPSIMGMLYNALDKCENDGEKSAIRNLINGLEKLNSP